MSLCFFLQGGQDLFLLGGQQVLQGGAGCLGLLRGGTVLPWASSVFWEQERSFVSRSSVKMACFILSSSASTFI